MLNFLAGFCPNLNNVFKALRKSTHKDAPFQSTDSHGKAFVESKKLIAQGPVSCHFSPQLALILQVDVFGLALVEGSCKMISLWCLTIADEAMHFTLTLANTCSDTQFSCCARAAFYLHAILTNY